jgi:hypothetical protein
MTLRHQPHQLRRFPCTSRPRISPLARSSSHSGTHAPTFTIRTRMFFMTPPIPSTSCLSYPGFIAGLGVLLSWTDAPDELTRLLRLAELLPAPIVVAAQGVREEALLLGPLGGVVAASWKYSASRASSASPSISCSRSRAAQHSVSRPQMTPRSPSPIPVPRPPRTSVY